MSGDTHEYLRRDRLHDGVTSGIPAAPSLAPTPYRNVQAVCSLQPPSSVQVIRSPRDPYEYAAE